MKVILLTSSIFLFLSATPGLFAQSMLPEGPNQKLVELVCSKCHTTDRIASKRMTKKEWTEEVAEMLQEEDDVSEVEKDMIIEYLAKTFPASEEINQAKATGRSSVQCSLQENRLPVTGNLGVTAGIHSYRAPKGFQVTDHVLYVSALNKGRIATRAVTCSVQRSPGATGRSESHQCNT